MTWAKPGANALAFNMQDRNITPILGKILTYANKQGFLPPPNIESRGIWLHVVPTYLGEYFYLLGFSHSRRTGLVKFVTQMPVLID